MQAHIDKINEMASVMRKAIEVDEGQICEDEERIKQLEVKANPAKPVARITSNNFQMHMKNQSQYARSSLKGVTYVLWHWCFLTPIICKHNIKILTFIITLTC